MIKGPAWPAGIVLALMLAAGAWAGLGYGLRSGQLPSGLGAWRMLYGADVSHGIGMPGDNETGLFVYALSGTKSDQIAKGGVAYLSRIAPDWEWQETPVEDGGQWRAGDASGGTRPPGYRAGIEDFLDRYGFGFSVPFELRREIDEIFNGPGGYFALGAGGSVVIVMPKTRKVVFAYAG